MSTTIWRGPIVWGFVSIPVRLVKGARREQIEFHNVCGLSAAPEPPADPVAQSGDGAAAPVSNLRVFPAQRNGSEPFAPPLPEHVERVRQMLVGEVSRTPVARGDVLKGFRVRGADGWVVFAPSELAALRAPTSPDLKVERVVGCDEINPVFYDVSHYVEPEDGAEKAYSLFQHTLAETGCVAIGELAFHGREFAVAIRPGSRGGLVLYTLFFPHEVRAGDEKRADRRLFDEREFELSKALLAAKRGTFEPAKLRDKYRERLHQAIQEKCRAKFPASEAEAPPYAAPVTDIADALLRSLDAVPKPPCSEGSGSSRRKGQKRRSKG